MKRAFTLVEILVVLVIVGILIGLILPNTLKAIRQAQVKECASNIRSLNSALQMCYTQTRNWGECLTPTVLRDGGYIEDIPVCPFGTEYTVQEFENQRRVNADDHMDTWPNFRDHD